MTKQVTKLPTIANCMQTVRLMKYMVLLRPYHEPQVVS